MASRSMRSTAPSFFSTSLRSSSTVTARQLPQRRSDASAPWLQNGHRHLLAGAAGVFAAGVAALGVVARGVAVNGITAGLFAVAGMVALAVVVVVGGGRAGVAASGGLGGRGGDAGGM